MAALSLVNPTPEPLADFEAFWLLWAGKRQEKKMCKLQWGYLHSDDQMKAIVAAAAWRPLWLRKESAGEGEYLPTPLKWLHGERWEDELPRTQLQTAQAHVPFQPSAPGERAEMPEHVRAMIAKLRGQK